MKFNDQLIAECFLNMSRRIQAYQKYQLSKEIKKKRKGKEKMSGNKYQVSGRLLV